MRLYQRQFGEVSRKPPLLLLHGMLGSSSNWQGVATRLAERGYVCIVPDLRNHGRSPHDPSMDYPLMAGDVLRMLDELEVSQVTAIGHSMGAKTAMWLALNYSDRVDRLVSVDMAPVRSPNRFEPIFDALLSLDLQRMGSRREADAHLAESLDNPLLRQYLLQNLIPVQNGGEPAGVSGSDDGASPASSWRWRMNLGVLDAALETILDFPQVDSLSAFQGDALFLYGGESDYVSPDAAPAIQRLFPYARMRPIAGAGHWVYAEQPEAFLEALLHFLD
jgi:esterase